MMNIREWWSDTEKALKEFLLDKRIILVIISVTLFSLIAHSYRWNNANFNHDSLLFAQYDDYLQRSTGRFLIPLYIKFRGLITSPMLIGVLSILYICISVTMVVHVLDFKDRFTIITLCAVFSTFSVTAVANASFLPWVDVYMASLMLSTAAVFFFVKIPYGWIISVICTVGSLGLYQCYIEVAVVLIVLWLIRECFIRPDIHYLIRKSVSAVCFLAIGGAIYYAAWKIALEFHHVEALNSINSMAGFGKYSGYDIPDLLIGVYREFFRFVIKPLTFHPKRAGIMNLVLAGLALIPGIRVMKHCKVRLFLILLLLLYPFSSNFVYILSKRYVTQLMVYSFSFFYSFVLLWFEIRSLICSEKVGVVFAFTEKVLLFVLFFFIIFGNIVYSNELYLKRDLESQATLSAMTRILAKMESTEGYIPGEMPVVLEGDINNSTVSRYRPGFDYPELLISEINHNYSVTHYYGYLEYFEYILGYPLNAASLEEFEEYAKKPEVIAMPAFPNGDYCKIVDGALVVKLSEDMHIFSTEDMMREDTLNYLVEHRY